MDRIAVISDIHGNMTALEAVLNHIQKNKVDRLICLGDLIGKGPNSARVVDCIRDVCDTVVQGNWDDFIGSPTDYDVLKWHQRQLGQERVSYLNHLPFHTDFYLSGKRVRLFHASSLSVHHRVLPFRQTDDLKEMFKDHEPIVSGFKNRTPDIVGYGDIHSAFQLTLEHNDERRLLFNAGSVGNPLDLPQASFVILEGVLNSKEPSAYSIQFQRVLYDIEKELEIAEKLAMPDLEPYASELRTAVYRGRQKRENN